MGAAKFMQETECMKRRAFLRACAVRAAGFPVRALEDLSLGDESRREPAPAKKSKRGASAERMREITRARVAKRRARSETTGSSVPPIEVFVTDRQYLGLNPSPYQLT